MSETYVVLLEWKSVHMTGILCIASGNIQ